MKCRREIRQQENVEGRWVCVCMLRVSSAALSILVSASALGAPPTEAEQTAAIEGLRKTIQTQPADEDVESLRASYYLFRNEIEKPVTRDELHRALRGLMEGRFDGGFEEFLSAWNEQQGIDASGAPDEQGVSHGVTAEDYKGSYLMSGNKVRETYVGTTLVFNGSEKIVRDGDQHQVLVGESSQVSYGTLRLKDFRFTIPRKQLSVLTSGEAGMTVVDLTDDWMTISGEIPFHAEINRSTGYVRLVNAYDDNGQLAKETRQVGEMLAGEEKFLFPRVRFTAKYENENVTGLELMVVNEIDVNLPIDDSEFSVDIAAGEIFADLRSDKTYKAVDSSEDVVAKPPKGRNSASSRAGDPAEEGSGTSFLFWFNAIAIVGFLCFLAGRRLTAR